MINQTSESSTLSAFSLHQFLVITLLTSVWVQVSEVFRYLVIVRPEMQDYLSIVPDVVNMTLPIFLIWCVWNVVNRINGVVVLVMCPSVRQYTKNHWTTIYPVKISPMPLAFSTYI